MTKSDDTDDFFFTTDDLYLLAKGLGHLVDCECSTIQDLTDIFPLLAKIEALNLPMLGLEHLAETWNDRGVEE